MEKKKLYKASIELGFKLGKGNYEVVGPPTGIGDTGFDGTLSGPAPALANPTAVVAPTPIQPIPVGDTGNYFQDFRDFFEKQPDLLYGLSIFASEGVNKNRDAFLREVLCKIFKTPRNKFVDWEHDAEGTNDDGQNPNKYQIVGHIYDSKLASQITGSMIPDDEVIIGSDGKYFDTDSSWRGQPLDLLTAWVIYKFQFPELAVIIENMTDIDKEHFGVSMEILFSDYKFRIGGSLNPEETFDFDGNSTGAWEVRKGNVIADNLQKLWAEGKGRIYNGQSVIRILGGDIFFSGMAITRNRANNRSMNLSVGSYLKKAKKEKKQSSELIKMIEAIASRSETFDMKTCEIVDGKPSCECLEQAVASKIELLHKELDSLLSSMAKLTKKEE